MTNKRMFSLLICAAVLVSACNRSKDPTAAPDAHKANEARPAKDEIALSAAEQATAAIDIEPAKVSRQPDVLRANGRIVLADDRTWRVGVRTDGLVIEVYAGLGDYVKKGQVLARFHADEVRDTRALYRTAVSELDRANAARTQAGRAYERARRLLDLKAGSVQQVEQAQQDVSSADASIRKAEIEIDRTRDVLEDDLRVPVEPNAANPLADDVPILAPADGFVIEKNVTPGKTVSRVTDTFVLGDLSRVWMLASVRPEDLSKLRMGQAAIVTPGSGEATLRYPGRIANLGQQFDPETRVMQIRIELNNSGNQLRPEMLANAEIPLGGAKPALAVPSEALQQVNGQDVVFVKIAPDRFAVRPVRVGETIAGRTPILEGIKAGDQVVVHGSFILKSRLLKSTLESE